jgi:hypothetical protein
LLRVKSEIFGFDLASSVQTATRASHDLYVVVLALSALDVSDDILDISEAVGSCKSEDLLSAR